MHLTTIRNRNDQSQNNRVRNSIQGNLILELQHVCDVNFTCDVIFMCDVLFMCDVTFRGVKSPCHILI